MAPASTTTRRRPLKHAPANPEIHAAEISLAELPTPSPHLDSPVLDLETHRATVAAALAEAKRRARSSQRARPT
jgi:hypothetical protein